MLGTAAILLWIITALIFTFAIWLHRRRGGTSELMFRRLGMIFILLGSASFWLSVIYVITLIVD